MTLIIDNLSSSELAPMTEVAEVRHPLDDQYEHFYFREGDDAERTHLAWRMHAEGYLLAGFINDSAITADGELPPDMDKARGPHVDYRLALTPGNERSGSTWREINVPQGGTFRDLPAFQYTSGVLPEESVALLEKLSETSEFKEIAAMGRTSSNPTSMYEIIRNAVRDASGKNQVWLFSIVTKTLYGHLIPTLGAESFQVIGGEVNLDDPRVKEEVCLTPVIFSPDNLLANIQQSMQQTEAPAARRRLLRSLSFFAHGLSPDEMPEAVSDTLRVEQAKTVGGVGLRSLSGRPNQG